MIKKSPFVKRFSLVLIMLLALAACTPATTAAPTPTDESGGQAEAETADQPTSQPEPAPPTAEPPPELSGQPYTAPSGAFSLYLPKDWNCSETGQFRVDCETADRLAGLTLRAIATGYELLQPAFEALTTAELAHTYSDMRSFNEKARDTSEGRAQVDATWTWGELQWQSRDILTRNGAGVYHLSMRAEAGQWARFAPLFGEAAEKVNFIPQALSAAPLYEPRFTYTDPAQLFTLEIPTAWSKYADISSLENTRLEGFRSPDMHAGVDVAIYQLAKVIKQEAKAGQTLKILHKLYGNDLSVPKGKDIYLKDGRERLEWHADNKDISGISFFDSFGGTLFVFTVLWDNSFEGMYRPNLEAVMDSFTYR